MNNQIDYQEVLARYPWLIAQNQMCVLSPDSDGFLCGLFTAHHLNWKVCGFYDGKILILKQGVHPRDCIFLDMEIFRKDVRSVGQHMVMFNKDRLPENWSNFENCLSANNMRGFDAKHNFPQKYPLATIHLLIGVLGSLQQIPIPTTAICPLLYTDGTFKNLFNFPENCLSWLHFLQAEQTKNPLHSIFFSDHYDLKSMMIALTDLFSELRSITGGTRGGDKLKFSNGKGELINFDQEDKKFAPETLARSEMFLRLLATKTGWNYNPDHWSWNDLSNFQFQKGSIKPSQGRYDELMLKNPISLAMTSTLEIEYTLDIQQIF